MDYNKLLLYSGNIFITSLLFYRIYKRYEINKRYCIIKNIYIYPIKSLRHIKIDHKIELTKFGLKHDRRWLFIKKSNGDFITSRNYPMLLLIEPKIIISKTNKIILSLKNLLNNSTIDIPLSKENEINYKIRIWKSNIEKNNNIYDQGNEISKWIKEQMIFFYKKHINNNNINNLLNDENFINEEFRLVYMGDDCFRSVNVERAINKSIDKVSFADGYPILICNKQSLNDLNQKLIKNNEESIDMLRFRPNIVIDNYINNIITIKPFDEDNFKILKLSNIKFYNVKPCDRCKVPTIDYNTGLINKNNEPTKTLKTYRRIKNTIDVFFGINIIPQFNMKNKYFININDKLQIIE